MNEFMIGYARVSTNEQDLTAQRNALVRTIQTGKLDTVRESLNGKQQTAIEYGVGALAGGVARFVFGREVIKAAGIAFADAPDAFPPNLALPLTATSDADDSEAEPTWLSPLWKTRQRQREMDL